MVRGTAIYTVRERTRESISGWANPALLEDTEILYMYMSTGSLLTKLLKEIF
jgi:hypothetical protein